mgnify:CR=1 FL=1
MGVIKFSTQVGSHKLDVLTNDALQGTYYRDESGKVSIVSVFAVNPGQGHFSAFLDALPRNETVEFDNVVSRKVRGAVSRRGFVDRSGMDDWIRLASPESGE